MPTSPLKATHMMNTKPMIMRMTTVASTASQTPSFTVTAKPYDEVTVCGGHFGCTLVAARVTEASASNRMIVAAVFGY